MADISFMPPGLRGYLAGQQQNQAADAQTLQGLSGLLALQGTMHKQAQEQAFRDAISKATTPEEQAMVAAKFGGPEGILKHVDRLATIKATQEATMSRLSQAAQQFESNYQLRRRAATTQEERLALDQQREVFKQNLQAEAQRLSGARANYDFGFMPGQSAAPTVAPPATAAPAAAPAQGLSPMLANSRDYANAPPENQAAIRTMADAMARGQTGSVLADAPGTFIPGTTPQAAPAPPPAPVVAPVTRASSFGPEARFAPVGQPAPGLIPVKDVLTPDTAPAAAPAAPAMPVMPPEIASAPRKVQDQWRLQQTKPSIAGAGELSPATLQLKAEQALAGDSRALVGFARNQKNMTALSNAVADLANKRRISGKDLAAITAEYAGFTAGQRTVGTRQAQIEIAANVTDQFAPIAIAASEGFDRTPWKSLNEIQKAVDSHTASPELRRFNFANNSLVNAYARAINPVGVGNQYDKEHAFEILNTGFSKGDYKAAVEQLQVEINAELKAPAKVKQEMHQGFVNPAAGTPARRASDATAAKWSVVK